MDKQSARPPQPTYCANTACSSGVANRSSRSSFFSSRMARTLLLNRVPGVPFYNGSISIDLLNKSNTVVMYDLRTVAGVLRSMYQREMGCQHFSQIVQIVSGADC
mgnify:CR=1 FL=1